MSKIANDGLSWSGTGCFIAVPKGLIAPIFCLQTAHLLLKHCLYDGWLQVHKQNTTKLAELIRDTYKGRCDPLFLKRVSVLTVLVEIGIDKLFRDYTHIFLGNCQILNISR